MGLYKNNNGVLSPIAGRGKAEYGASTVRKGTATYTGAAVGTYPAVNVTFDTPMPDADYEIFFDYDEASGHGELNYMGYYGVYKRTANGFQIVFSGEAAISSGWNVKYTAYKLYTDNEYNGLLNNQKYSTDEIDTGKTWIDGKKIYRKVVELSSQLNIQPNAGWTNICAAPDGITNLILCYIKQSGNCDWTAGAFYRFYQGYIQAYPISATTMGITQIVLEYTKTT